MRQYLLLIMSVICLAVSAQEQTAKPRPPRMTTEEFQAQQKEYIIRYAELTEEESTAFFTLYFDLQNKKREINSRVWKNARAMRSQERTEEEYLEVVDALADAKIECATLEKQYLAQFKKILPAKKLMRVQMAEDRFQREILKGMQQGQHKKPERKQ